MFPLGSGDDRWGTYPRFGWLGSIWDGHPHWQVEPVHGYGRHSSTSMSSRYAGCGHQQWS